eukprot:gene19025-25619_t
MASSSSSPAPTLPPSVYASGDIELRFGNNQEPLRAHSVLLSLASPTVLGPMLSAEGRKASYLEVLVGTTWYFELDTFFSAMPILHKYDFSALLKHAAGLVESEVAWGQGCKTLQHTVGEWLWLIDELQLVGMHDAFEKLIKGLPRSRLCGIVQEVTSAAPPSMRITAAGMNSPTQHNSPYQYNSPSQHNNSPPPLTSPVAPINRTAQVITTAPIN